MVIKYAFFNNEYSLFYQDTPAYLGTALGDIVLNKSDNTIQTAKITQLFYFLKQESPSVREYSTDFEYAAERFILKGFESKLIELSFAHYQSLQVIYFYF